MAYDRQLIAVFGSGSTYDGLITGNAESFHKKAVRKGVRSAIEKVPVGVGNTGIRGDMLTKHRRTKRLQKALGELTKDSRLYLQGHGDWQSQKLGNYTGDGTAEMLVMCGLKQVQLVSVLGCQLGRDRGSSELNRLRKSSDSYASHLHRRLGDLGVKTIVFARIYDLSSFESVMDMNREDTRGMQGSKVTWATADADGKAEAPEWKADGSKIRFEWKDGQQVRSDAYFSEFALRTDA